MKPFIDDILWGVVRSPEKGWYYVARTVKYNSLEPDLNVNFFDIVELHYIPQKEIQNLHLLNGLNFNMVAKYRIPVLTDNGGIWKIDLEHYDKANINLQRKKIGRAHV